MAVNAPPMPVGSDRLPNDRMAILFLVMLVTAAGNTAMQSIMPSIGTKLGISDFWVSLAYSWSALLWVMTAPRWARMSDRRGRKALMKLGMWGFISSFSLCGLALWFGLQGMLSGGVTLLIFAIFRSLYGGLGSAAPPAVQAYVASRTARSERTKALSLIASSFGLGTVIGPAIAPLIIFPFLGLLSPFVLFALFGLIVLAALRLRLPNDDPRFAAKGRVISEPYGTASSSTKLSDEGDDDSAETVTETVLKWTDTRLRPWFVSGLIGGHAHAILLGIIGFLVLDRLGLRDTPELGAQSVGIVLMAGAFATLVSQWGLIPYLGMGPRTSVLWGMAVGGLGSLLVGLSGDLHGITIGYALASLGFGLFRPGFTAGASLVLTRAEQGQVAGMVASINGAAFVFAPALGVLIYGWNETVAFGLLILLCAVLLLWGYRTLQLDSVLEKSAIPE